MMGEEEGQTCDTNLSLGLGGGRSGQGFWHQEKRSHVQIYRLFPSCKKEEEGEEEEATAIEEHGRKRLRLKITEIEDDAEQNSQSMEGGNKKGGMRKKLRLTKEQSTLLEDSFRRQNTLNLAQKQEFAERLRLQPRQVEVWFQNRRARTKLKQTEVGYEFLKKCCERLSNENMRLKHELHELLRSSIELRPGAPYHTQAAPLFSICPSCEGAAKADGGCGGSNSTASISFDDVIPATGTAKL